MKKDNLYQINERVRFVYLYDSGYDSKYKVLKGKIIDHSYDEKLCIWKYTLDPSDCGYCGHKVYNVPETDINPDMDKLEKLSSKQVVEMSKYYFHSDSINKQRKDEIENPVHKDTYLEGYRIIRASDFPSIEAAISDHKQTILTDPSKEYRAFHYTLTDDLNEIIAFAVIKKHNLI